MSSSLGFAQQLLDQADHYHKIGHRVATKQLLTTLIRLDLPPRLACQALAMLAEWHEAIGEFRDARRHLSIALRFSPTSGELHHRMAALLDLSEEEREPRRALFHYSQAVKYSPKQATRRRDYGLALIHQGQPRAGLRQLRIAYALEPDDLENLRALALHLVELDRASAARRLLRTAAFRHQGSSAYLQLHSQVSFAIARREQEVERRAVTLVFEEPPAILPFLCPVRTTPSRLPEGAILRFDGPSTAQPHVPRPARFRLHQTN